MPPKRKLHTQPEPDPEPASAAAAATAPAPTTRRATRHGAHRPQATATTTTTTGKGTANPSPPQPQARTPAPAPIQQAQAQAQAQTQVVAKATPPKAVADASPGQPSFVLKETPVSPPAIPSYKSPSSSAAARNEPQLQARQSHQALQSAMGSLGALQPDVAAPDMSYYMPQSPYQQHSHNQNASTSIGRQHGHGAAQSQRLNNRTTSSQHVTPAVVTPVPPPTHSSPASKPSPRTDRNIDKVVLGNLCFRTWYPSYYGKEVLGDLSRNNNNPGKNASGSSSKETSNGTTTTTAAADAAAAAAGRNPSSKKDREHQQQAMLERLYVCPRCFKYSKELVPWWGHVRVCEQQGHVPGRKVYTHPRGERKVLVPQGNVKGPGTKRRRGEAGVRYVEETIQNEGEWSIWEVDGEKDVLFCQNLSLFAKLFLDNKSVFFDVTGFNYFLLVYTPPLTTPADATAAGGHDPPSSSLVPEPPKPQVTGFFSKEKMSWDNNNLACILVFPPWQRKGLGALLMGASYEISRREGIMGGPEKPISDLGKKGYKRFWAGEIARWLLSLDVETMQSDGTRSETLVDVKDCSQATWISLEDCLAVLRDMGVVEDAGLGPRKVEKKQLPETKEDGPQTEDGGGANANQQEAEHGERAAEESEQPPSPDVPRVRLDKEAVRRYVANHRISLEKTCFPGGFVEGYATPKAEANGAGEEEPDH